MTAALTIECDVHFERRGRGFRKELAAGPAPQRTLPPGRVPRVARLMALALRFDGFLRAGHVGSYAELAVLGYVTRPRVSQVMNLLNLAPDIQERLLFLPRTERGRDPIHLRQLQPIASTLDWRKQRRLWAELVEQTRNRNEKSPQPAGAASKWLFFKLPSVPGFQRPAAPGAKQTPLAFRSYHNKMPPISVPCHSLEEAQYSVRLRRRPSMFSWTTGVLSQRFRRSARPVRRQYAQLRREEFEVRIVPSAISDAAYPLLNQLTAGNQQQFYVYQDADSAYNHGFPSGFFGTISKIHLNTAALDDPSATSGVSTDPNRLDAVHRNVMQIVFDPLNPGEFADINIEEPENWGVTRAGIGYDLRNAGAVVFDVRSPTPGGVNVQFGVGMSQAPFVHVPQSSSYSTMAVPLASLSPALTDLSNVHVLFTIVTNDINAPQGGTVLLDNIRFEPIPTSQQSALSLPLANETLGVMPLDNPSSGRNPFPLDQVLRNLATTYESALTLLVLLDRGSADDLQSARLIANAFVYALAHDNRGDPLPVAPDGATGLHNAYEAGDLTLHNGQGAGQGQQGGIRLGGFSSTISPTGFALVLDGATGGNNAFAMLALTRAYQKLQDPRYLTAAEMIGNWIAENLADTTGTGFGGYSLGYPDEGKPKTLMIGKSTENNADIFAAFSLVSAVERGLNHAAVADLWTARANAAGDFVLAMFDPAAGRFYAGTVPAGTTGGPGVNPSANPQLRRGNDVVNDFDFLDSNSFAVLALAAASRYRNALDWRRPVQYILDHFAQTITVSGTTFRGLDIVESPIAGPNGIAWEFTGQAVAAMNFVDHLYGETRFAALANFYLGQIRMAQTAAPFAAGSGLVASTVQDGASLPPIDQSLSTPFQNIAERVGLGATAWAILADRSSVVGTVAIGADAGGGPNVLVMATDQNVFAQEASAIRFNFLAYDPRFTGGVRVAVGDLNGDGVPDIITAPGPGGGPDIHVYDGSTGSLIQEFFAFDPRFTGGCYVAAGDTNGDGLTDIIIGADAGGGPNVKVFNGKDGSVLLNFFAYDPSFTGGVRVAAGDVDGDGRADLICGAGAGGGPNVTVFNGTTGALERSFFAFDPRFSGGVYVAAGDTNGDGFADIVAGSGAGGGPDVAVYEGKSGILLYSIFAYDPAFTGGVRVAAGDMDGDGKADVICGPGPGGEPDVRIFNGISQVQIDQFFAFNPLFTGGLFVGR
jgi:hypothetical protein